MIARALEKGADDYIVKPFSLTELMAMIQAALRRRQAPSPAQPTEPYVRGDLTIDYAERLVRVAGRPVHLTAIEYGLLFEPSVHGGRVLTHDQILQRVWGRASSGNAGTIRTHLMRLRRKLGEDAASPKYIFAEPRVGYRMARGRNAGTWDGMTVTASRAAAVPVSRGTASGRFALKPTKSVPHTCPACERHPKGHNGGFFLRRK